MKGGKTKENGEQGIYEVLNYCELADINLTVPLEKNAGPLHTQSQAVRHRLESVTFGTLGGEGKPSPIYKSTNIVVKNFHFCFHLILAIWFMQPAVNYCKKEVVYSVDGEMFIYEWNLYLHSNTLSLSYTIQNKKAKQILSKSYIGKWRKHDDTPNVTINNTDINKKNSYTLIVYGDSIRVVGGSVEFPSYMIRKY